MRGDKARAVLSLCHAGLMTSEVGRRASNRAAMERAILAAGERHLARDGAAALSLRAIARDLGVASSAVYRYVDSRDELLTRLIVTAYDSLGDAVDAALEKAGAADPREQFRIIGRTLRAWARAHPEQFALVYGSPVPGYAAPAERTNPAGTRVTDRLMAVLPDLPRPSRPALDRVGIGEGTYAVPAEVPPGTAPQTMTVGFAAWAMVLGSVTAEVFQQYGPDAVADWAAHFEGVLELALATVTD
jgi:AcrR family transcriptional regulator